MAERRSWRRPAFWGFAAGGLLFVIGAPLPHAILTALAVVATGPALHAASIELHDRPDVPHHLRREGSRRELAKLTRYRGRRTRGTDDEAVRRLRTVARRRLADLGVDADDPADRVEAGRLLGQLAYGVLLDPPASRPVPDRHFSRCIDAVDALGRHRQDRAAGQDRATAQDRAAGATTQLRGAP
jgi:hypothetical protein